MHWVDYGAQSVWMKSLCPVFQYSIAVSVIVLQNKGCCIGLYLLSVLSMCLSLPEGSLKHICLDHGMGYTHHE